MSRCFADRVRMLAFVPALLCGAATCWGLEPVSDPDPSSGKADRSQESIELERFLRIPDEELPEHVHLKQPLRTTPVLPLTRNPEVLDNPQHVKILAKFFRLQDASDLKEVRAALVAVYYENDPANEIGVFGLSFSEKATAKRHFARLTKDVRNPAIILKGRLLLHVWKDPRTGATAFEAIRDHLKEAEFPPEDRKRDPSE